MLVTDGTPVHFPAKTDKFEFDSEVATVFRDMAARSIPNFHAAHSAHVGLAAGVLQKPDCSILDVGASRGAFYEHILQAGHQHVQYTAVDCSAPMCSMLQNDYPSATVLPLDITGDAFRLLCEGNKYDVVCCNYVLQFVPMQQQIPLLLLLLSAVKPRGLFFLGHKASHIGDLGDLCHEEYIKFRLKNGYSREEIVAKTLALKGSMFPMDHTFVLNTLKQQCREVQETTRFMMFSTLAARV